MYRWCTKELPVVRGQALFSSFKKYWGYHLSTSSVESENERGDYLSKYPEKDKRQDMVCTTFLFQFYNLLSLAIYILALCTMRMSINWKRENKSAKKLILVYLLVFIIITIIIIFIIIIIIIIIFLPARLTITAHSPSRRIAGCNISLTWYITTSTV